jgi:hypothetical protein
MMFLGPYSRTVLHAYNTPPPQKARARARTHTHTHRAIHKAIELLEENFIDFQQGITNVPEHTVKSMWDLQM